MLADIFKFRRANAAKLTAYGFVQSDGAYKYQTPIMDGQFTLFVEVDDGGDVKTQLIDVYSQEEYVLHLTSGVGEFVGKVRAEFEQVLSDVRDKCFERDVFKGEQGKQVIEYVRQNYDGELEFLWEKFDNNAICRRKDNNKWYVLFVVLPKRKLGVESCETVEIIDVRAELADIQALVDNKGYFIAYHMNKKSWLTVCLDGTVKTSDIFRLIDKSYQLALKK